MLPHARWRGKRLRRGEQSNKTQINDRVLFKVKQGQTSTVEKRKVSRVYPWIAPWVWHLLAMWPWEDIALQPKPFDTREQVWSTENTIEMLILKGFGFCMCVRAVYVDVLMCKYAGILCEKRRVWKPEVGVRCLPQAHYCIYWCRICLSPSPRAHQGSSSLARQFALFCLLRAVIIGRSLDIYVGSGTWTLILTVARETLYLLSYLSTSNLEF